MTVPTLPRQAKAVVTWDTVNATDNSDVVSVSSSSLSGTNFFVGEETVTITAMDGSGNQAECSFVITVIDVEPPSFIRCPGDQTLTLGVGEASARVTWANPLAVDNTVAYTLSSNASSGDQFGPGATIVGYVATDEYSNTETCTFVITVIDDQPPVFTVCNITSIEQATDMNSPTATVIWTEPVATDNAGPPTVTTNYAVASRFPLGTSVVQYVATDSSGNNATCQFTVVVSDEEKPRFLNCPAGITTAQDAGEAYATVTWDPQPVDNVNITSSISSHTNGTQFNLGSYSITIRVEDAAGNFEICVFLVNVLDLTAPVIRGCPGITLATALPGLNYTTPFWFAPTATDPTGPVTVTNNYNPLDNFYIGDTLVTYSFVDVRGNVANCSFFVRVSDNQPPVIENCPMNITTGPDAGNLTALVNWTEPTITDNDRLVNVSQNYYPNTIFSGGTVNVVYLASDVSGNMVMCSFFVTVTDGAPPNITGCPSDIVTVTLPGNDSAVVNWTAPTATDNTGTPTLNSNKRPLDLFGIGNTTVTYTATDAFALTDTCSFVVTVNDEENPVITNCTSMVEVSLDPNSDMANVSWTPPTATDNSGVVQLTSNIEPYTVLPVGEVTVNYVATDPSGNEDTCSFVVRVIDTTAPVFTGCVPSITVEAEPGMPSVVVTWDVNATDNSGFAMVTSTMVSGSRFLIGDHSVNITAVDLSNNTATCSISITVVDGENPSLLNCSANITQSTDFRSPTAVVMWPEPIANDNSGIVTLNSTRSSGSTFDLGSSEVVYTATDGNGNTANCSFFVEVQDLERPRFLTCEPNFSLDTLPSVNYSTISSPSDPMAVDNAGTPTVTTDYNLTSVFYVGETQVRYTATDPSGNIEVCRIIVEVSDPEAPVFPQCPPDQTITLLPSESSRTVDWLVPIAQDNVGIHNTTESLPPNSTFSLGRTYVTYTAFDTSGNSAECQFYIEIQDNTPPSVVNCSADVAVDSSEYTPGEQLFTVPSATDANGINFTTSSHSPNYSFPLGATTVVYTFTDSANNTAECSFLVTINDNEAPEVLFCPSSRIYEAMGGLAYRTVNWTEPVFRDNSGNVTVSSSFTSPLNVSILGSQNIFYTARDAAGNMAVCSFTLTGTDTMPPTYENCPTDFSVNNTAGLATAFVTWTEPTAVDNGVIGSEDATLRPNQTLSIGNYTITYTARDLSYSVATCEFVITVLDVEDPVLSNCPSDIVDSVEASSSTVNVTWTPPTATDNNMTVGLKTTHEPFSLFTIGNTTVTYTATDGSGNMATCSFVVAIKDPIPPTINCPSSVSLTTDPGRAVASNISLVVNASDNSGTPVISSNLPGDEAGLGSTSVTATAMDGSGNSVMCTFNITVTDEEQPMFQDCPSDLHLNTTNVARWTVPTATDNSMVVVSTTASHEPDVFPPGDTTVVYNATDPSGNVGSCQFVVTIDATDSPVVTNCPMDITVNASLVTFQAVVSWTEPNVTDTNLAGLNKSHSPGDSFPLGTTTVTYVYSDTTNKSTTCAFDVTVLLFNDTTPPVFDSCPSNFTHYTPVGNSSAVVTWPLPTASDSSGLAVTITSNYDSGDLLNAGFITVQYIAADTFNNTALCEFTVELIEDFAPVFDNCTKSIVVSTDPSAPNTTVNWTEPIASDVNGPVSTSSNYSPPRVFSIGTEEVVYEATDGTNNTVTCSFNVTVEDRENPVIDNCPPAVTVYVQDNATSGDVSWTAPTARDNSGSVTITGNRAPGTYNLGTYTTVYSALDPSGNEELCTFVITVIEDQSPEFVDCPMDIVQETDAGENFATVNWTAPTVTDDRNNATVSTPNYQPGDTFVIGTTTVQYDATDGSGNTATCSFTVTVQDNEDPVLVNCPSAITDRAVASSSIKVSWTPPDATDNDVVTSLSVNIQPNTSFPIGEHDIIYTAEDNSTNVATCTFRITILEDQPPTFNFCPGSLTQNTDASSPTATVTWTPPVAVDDDAGVTNSSNANPGDTFPIGTSTVTYTATDSAGQTATCSFDVTVRDRENPTLVGCPMDFTERIVPGAGTIPVTWTAPTGMDNSGSVTVTGTQTPGTNFGQGFHPVIYIALDASGNRASCSFLITVDEDQPPVVSDCQGDLTVNTDAGQNYATRSWTEPSAVDDGGSVTNTTNVDANGQFPVGTTNVVYNFTDSVGQVTQCIFDVTVQDNEDPVFTGCPNIPSRTLPVSQLPVVISWAAPTVTDNTGNVTVDVNRASGSLFSAGTTAVSYTATDAYGNTAVCTFDVVIVVDAPPEFVACQPAITQPTGAGLPYASVTWTQPTATDDEGAVTVTSDIQPGSNFTIGETPVTVTATDTAGSQTTCTFTVTIQDQEKPVLTGCPGDITAYVFSASDTAILSWTLPTATDNSGETITPVSIRQPGESFGVGSATVLYSATDSSQNTEVCSFVIIVQEAIGASSISASLTVSRIRNQVGPFASTIPTSTSDDMANDLQILFRQSALAATFAGVRISSFTASDPNAVASLVLYFTASSGVTGSDVENAFDSSLTTNQFDMNNEVPSANSFFTGNGPCASSPCRNSGTCTADDRVGFTCNCTAAYMGDTCEIDVNECQDNPCGVNQQCINNFGSFVCTCSMGFTNQNDVCVAVGVQLGGAFNIEELNNQPAVFTDDLNDQNSPAFTDLAGQVTEVLDEIYENTTGYLGAEIVSFSSGSIRVEYVLLFESSADSDSATAMLNDSISDTTGEIIDSNIIVRVDSVSTVDEVCSTDYCRNGGTCMVTTGLQSRCLCSDNYEGDRCEIDLSGIPIYVIVLSVAAVLLVIIVLVLLCLCYFVMRTSSSTEHKFIYNVEDGRENFTFGVPARDEMMHMRGPSQVYRSGERDSPTNERRRQDRSKHRSRNPRKYGEHFHHNTTPHQFRDEEPVTIATDALADYPRRLHANVSSRAPGPVRPENGDTRTDNPPPQTNPATEEENTSLPRGDGSIQANSTQQPYIATGEEAAMIYGRGNRLQSLDAAYF